MPPSTKPPSSAPPKARSNSCATATSSPFSATTKPRSTLPLWPRANHVTWQNVEKPAPLQQEANWLLQRPSIDRVIGAPEPADAQGRERFEATYTKPHIAHASVSPSCGLALYKDGHLTVWTHCQGVYPLRGALARTLKLDASAITVHHVQGAGCYGHNGADDAAADAAIIACERPGVPVRVRWRREEEFVYEPKAPAMVVKVRALVGSDGKPSDWTAEIWSGTHAGRPGHGSPLLGGEALPDPLPLPPPSDVPEAGGGGATRNAEPLYDIAAKRIVHHLVPETPVRVSSLRGLGAMANVFALECAIDELAERAGQDPVAYRLSITSDPRARAVIEKAASHGEVAGRRALRHRHAAAALPSRATRTAPATPPWWSSSTSTRTSASRHVWCAADAGLVVNPDGVINQLEGGIIQSASWVLKEQVRFDDGVSSIDWLTYPVLKFSEVPEIDIELINTRDPAPLGVGEVDRRADRGGHRQRRLARARRAHPRPAADARARHGGAVDDLRRAAFHGGDSDASLPSWRGRNDSQGPNCRCARDGLRSVRMRHGPRPHRQLDRRHHSLEPGKSGQRPRLRRRALRRLWQGSRNRPHLRASRRIHQLHLSLRQ